jgi:hypothetical protein
MIVFGTHAKARIMAALRAVFDFLALNLALVTASLLIVSLPLALEAAWVALQRWRKEGEDRVIREFLVALRRRAHLRSLGRSGLPLLAVLVAVEEVHFFAKGGSGLAWICLGSGSAALVIATSGFAYVLLLGAQDPSLRATQAWSIATKLALQNIFVTGPLFLLEGAVAFLLGLLDPALLLIGLPLAYLQLARHTAHLGIKRASQAR